MAVVRSKPTQLSLNDATASYLGYAYQGLYALVTLLDAADDESVSVETSDDVVLDGAEETLHQLKHTLQNPRPLSFRDARLWKTLAIWSDHYKTNPGRYVLVTTAPVSIGDPLAVLATDGDRLALHKALIGEVRRVQRARQRAAERGDKQPHERRHRGILAFDSLGSSRQLELLRRSSLHAQSATIRDLPSQVDERLRNTTLPEVREQITARLIEWWDRRVLYALMEKRERLISKAELQEHLSALIAQHRPGALPDDYGASQPPSQELAWDSLIVDQMAFVDAGEARIVRGLEAHWKAVRQRERWLADDISVSSQLTEYDERLFRLWRSRHGPMADDCKSRSEEEKRASGKQLLDWSHLKAYLEARPVRPDAPNDYVTQGTYQILAQQQRVGWHPEFLRLLRAQRGSRRAS